jgi:2-dehydro-3-deoxygalactonokinase
MTTHADWIAVWHKAEGLQVWLMSASGDLQGEIDATGMALTDLPQVLDGLVSQPVDVLICGRAQSGQGMAVPCKMPGAQDLIALPPMGNLRLFQVPYLTQSAPVDASDAQAMQIRAFLEREPKFDGILCLPGDQTLWAHISAEEVVSFRSFMSMEMLDWLCTGSDKAAQLSGDRDPSGFETACTDGLARPAQLAAALQGAHGAHMLGKPMTRDHLAGWLIGAELAATRPYWLGQEVVILSGHFSADLYNRALTAQAAWLREVQIEDAVLQGLIALRQGDDVAE